MELGTENAKIETDMSCAERFAVVIPCYKVEEKILSVIHNIPDCVDFIIAVDDCSPDSTYAILQTEAETNPRLTIVHHSKNQGVGGSMVSGFKKALELKADIIVKLDGDGQMNSDYIPKMLQILSNESYDYVKGNRFFNRPNINKMPVIRRIGNMGMGFFIKMASGYWHISDPANGYFAVRRETLQRINLRNLAKRFFFESSLLIELYYTGARIRDISMPAIYGSEKSNLSIVKTLLTFPPKLMKAHIKRILLRYFIYDFNINSLYILTGFPLFLFGLIFGICKWVHFAHLGVAAPTGTVMIAVLGLVLGFQIILASIQYDLTAPNPFEHINEGEL